jgi:NitT/TauT family transport system permease protein
VLLERARAFWGEYWISVASVIVAVGAWEIGVRLLEVPKFLIPTPSTIAAALVRWWDILLVDTWITFLETVFGFVAGSLVGLVIAIGIIFSRVLEKIVYPPTIVTQVVPKLAIAPLFIVWFGIGLTPKIMIIILMCLFPVLVNGVAGMRAVDPRMLDLMHSVNASRWQVFAKVQFPNAAPHVFAGLKVGITLAVVGAIVAEWLGANQGLGHQILMSMSMMRTDLLFAALLLLSVLGIALFGAIALLEPLVLPRQRQIEIADKLM